jgi:hypothetical protein
MKVIDHIGIFENAVPDEFCDVIIQACDAWINKKMTPDVKPWVASGENQFVEGNMCRKDEQLYLEAVDLKLAMQLNTFVGKAFEEYATEYSGIVQNSDPVSSWTTKVQKTVAGGGFHKWHCENGVYMYRDRVVTWMVYLNDIPAENGGATDFLYQKLSLHPKKGTLVLWPAAYTHMHRGGFLTGPIDKYIATGWFIREPGAVTDNFLKSL